ncbi:imm11 family protein [Sporomusa sphaeroides]|uniref:Immunity MXAN-0049 protein domain-containing protein n=1 Tax=Sporomusa sphaeroides DSM 2875 TaxID=1337886 RepID=A0ABM9W3K0_9FIRM|nr:DUF1629 domain-containing protein [Sporomusa sphaeroides]OLS55685.1 hypothetical protein SPSPH_30140 [Sporomusa sphaeroides DSM 2875]CVK19389.1 hypothetical protein SSPH_02040 [Sporomusa sphaeroides DSM 2875]
MKIWHLIADVDNFENLTTLKQEDWEKLRFDGKKLIDTWTPLAVRVIKDSKKSDTPGLSSGAPVLSLKAISILKDLIDDVVEVLPLVCSGGEYYIINVLDVVDCIDYERADFERYKSSGRIMLFNRYAFKPECVKGKHLFKIVDEPVRRPFVSDEFRNRVIESGLEGFKFEQVWDSEF